MAIERIIADDYSPDEPGLKWHIQRYQFAAKFLRVGDVVVDAACGTGYGSALLSEYCAWVHGYDKDMDAVYYARRRYDKSHASFEVLDLDSGHVALCDMLVSIETIEHLHDPLSFLRMAKDSTRRVIVLTTPIEPTKHLNEFHLQDFTKEHVEQMMLPWAVSSFELQVPDVRVGMWAFTPAPTG